MLHAKALLLSSLLGFSTIQAYAENKPEPSKQMAEFLALETENQRGFITTSVQMIGVIASQTKPEIARCVDDWYSADANTTRQRVTEIVDVMERFPNHLPTAIVLAIVERQCGKFDRVRKSE